MGKPMPKNAAATEKAPSEGIMGYLSAAAQRVVGHNFKGDKTEPEW